jgi:hypothetical protein
MSDEKYTKKEREFLRLHELEHTLMRLELAVIAAVGERGAVSFALHGLHGCLLNDDSWHALDVLKDVLLFQLPVKIRNEAIDFVINEELAGGITRPIAERGKPMPDQSHLYIDCTEVETK